MYRSVLFCFTMISCGAQRILSLACLLNNAWRGTRYASFAQDEGGTYAYYTLASDVGNMCGNAMVAASAVAAESESPIYHSYVVSNRLHPHPHGDRVHDHSCDHDYDHDNDHCAPSKSVVVPRLHLH